MSLEPSMRSSGWSHGCREPLPQRSPPSANQEPYPAPYPTTLLSPEEQPLRKKNFKSTQRRGGRERRERKRPGNSVDREKVKELQNPNRLQSCDWKKCFSWAGEKERVGFQGCSSWCETSWAQRLRTGNDALFFLFLDWSECFCFRLSFWTLFPAVLCFKLNCAEK